MVTRGITAQGVVWAFTTSVADMWYPLTWISYMLDSQMYGPKPWGYHLTNVLLHAATTVILFLALRRMTGNLWASALVALLFAIHPLRAEAVAWVGERKSPLSGLFFVSTIAAYVAYARRPFSLARYLAVAGLFTLGLLAKPTLVTLPFVLLLLDYWPLGRWQAAGIRDQAMSGPGIRNGRCRGGLHPSTRSSLICIPALRLVVEKIPLLLLSVACSVAAVLSQAGNIAVAPERADSCADRQRPDFLRRLSRPVLLAGRAGGLLSSFRELAGVAGGRRLPGLGRSFPRPPSCCGASSPQCWSVGCGTSARWCP